MLLQVPRVGAPRRALARGHRPVLLVVGVAERRLRRQGGRPQELLASGAVAALEAELPKLPFGPALLELPGGEVRERHLVLVRHGRRLGGVEPGVAAGQLPGWIHRVAPPLPGSWVLLVLGSLGGKFKLGAPTRGVGVLVVGLRRHEGPLDVADDALVGAAGLVQGPVHVGVRGLAPVLDYAHHDGHDEDEDDGAEADDRDEDVERLAVAVVIDVPVDIVGGGDLVGPDAVLDDPEVHALVGEGAEPAVGDEADVHAGVRLAHVLEDEAVEVLVVNVVVVVDVVVVAVALEVVYVDVVNVGGGGGVEDAVALAADGEGVGRGGGAGGEALQPLDVRLGERLDSAEENNMILKIFLKIN